MNKVDLDNLSDVLGIDLSVKEESNVVTLNTSEYQIEEVKPEETTNSDIDSAFENDFETAKTNIINIIEHGENVLGAAENIAVQTENPKSIEAFASLVNSLTNASEKLLELHSKKKSILDKSKKEESGNGSVTTNNTIAFVGSPSELRKILKNEATNI